jgi:hypothetical protein
MIIVFLLLFVQSVFAYNITNDFLNGFYWKDFPISISVDEDDQDLKTTIETIATEAIREWEDRTGLSLWDLKSGTRNSIRWSTNFSEETNMDSSTVLAVAIRYTTGPYFVRTEIIINGEHPLNLDQENLLTTITHELGHTMGLDHSNEILAVMAPNLQIPYNGLHEDDVEGIEYLVDQSQKRQLDGYVSPLSYEERKTSSPLGCGSVGIVGSNSLSGILSFIFGVLVTLVRKLFSFLK